MWEVFTTKPWFDRKELQYLGEVPTPWPAFVFVTQTSVDAPTSAGKSSRSGQEASASVLESSLKQDKAQLIRDRLFAALHKGITIFKQEAREISGGDGKGENMFTRCISVHLCVPFKMFSTMCCCAGILLTAILQLINSSAQYPAHHG